VEPESHAVSARPLLLPVIASEVASAIDGLLGDLDRRIDIWPPRFLLLPVGADAESRGHNSTLLGFRERER
jgi:hypothetical protein